MPILYIHIYIFSSFIVILLSWVSQPLESIIQLPCLPTRLHSHLSLDFILLLVLSHSLLLPLSLQPDFINFCQILSLLLLQKSILLSWNVYSAMRSICDSSYVRRLWLSQAHTDRGETSCGLGLFCIYLYFFHVMEDDIIDSEMNLDTLRNNESVVSHSHSFIHSFISFSRQ